MHIGKSQKSPEDRENNAPVIVLRAQLKVRKHNRDLGARNDQNGEHEQQKAKHVKILVVPHGRHDEEDLDEDGAKGQHTADLQSERGKGNERGVEIEIARDELKQKKVR